METSSVEPYGCAIYSKFILEVKGIVADFTLFIARRFAVFDTSSVSLLQRHFCRDEPQECLSCAYNFIRLISVLQNVFQAL